MLSECSLRRFPRWQRANADRRRKGIPYTENPSQRVARRFKGMNFITTRRRLVKDKAVRETGIESHGRRGKASASAGSKEAERRIPGLVSSPVKLPPGKANQRRRIDASLPLPSFGKLRPPRDRLQQSPPGSSDGDCSPAVGSISSHPQPFPG